MGATTGVDENYALTSEELDERLQASLEAAKTRRQARADARETLNGSRKWGLKRRHAAKLARGAHSMSTPAKGVATTDAPVDDIHSMETP